MKKPVVLVILDGYGISELEYGNAIKGANTPNMDGYFKHYPWTELGASGLDVGLPPGQMGNSEVGHTNIGAGRVVYQELTRISKAIKEGDFFSNPVLLEEMQSVKASGGALHLMGLLSDGGVHSHIEHLYGLLEMAKREGLEKVWIHCFLDGRDVSPTSGKQFIKELYEKCEELGIGKIATIAGRYYAMDRDNRWDRVEKAYAAIVYGEGKRDINGVDMLEASYVAGITDEFIEPTIVTEHEELTSKDSVLFFNFRPDRARELTRAFVDKDFVDFQRKTGYIKPGFVCMTQYDAKMPNVKVVFTPQSLENTFGKYISDKGLKQLRIAETEKYAHVTFFFNGGAEEAYKDEHRALISSPNVATYDLQPEMSAQEVTIEVISRIQNNEYDVIILNYANCDMVGHTGNFDATKIAVATVDSCLGKVVDAILKKGGIAIITADHGNADQMYERDGEVFTAHTNNKVPFMIIGLDCKLVEGGKLADIAPTMLSILGLEQPIEMMGKSLIKK